MIIEICHHLPLITIVHVDIIVCLVLNLLDVLLGVIAHLGQASRFRANVVAFVHWMQCVILSYATVACIVQIAV